MVAKKNQPKGPHDAISRSVTRLPPLSWRSDPRHQALGFTHLAEMPPTTQELEEENRQAKRIVADQALNVQVL